MPLPEPQIQVASGLDRPTQREQIDEIIARAQEKGGPVRIRLPLSVYNYAESRGYIELRDAAWNLQLSSEGLAPESVEALISAIHTFIRTLGEIGAAAVVERLQPPADHEGTS